MVKTRLAEARDSRQNSVEPDPKQSTLRDAGVIRSTAQEKGAGQAAGDNNSVSRSTEPGDGAEAFSSAQEKGQRQADGDNNSVSRSTEPDDNAEASSSAQENGQGQADGDNNCVSRSTEPRDEAEASSSAQEKCQRQADGDNESVGISTKHNDWSEASSSALGNGQGQAAGDKKSGTSSTQHGDVEASSSAQGKGQTAGDNEVLAGLRTQQDTPQSPSFAKGIGTGTDDKPVVAGSTTQHEPVAANISAQRQMQREANGNKHVVKRWWKDLDRVAVGPSEQSQTTPPGDKEAFGSTPLHDVAQASSLAQCKGQAIGDKQVVTAPFVDRSEGTSASNANQASVSRTGGDIHQRASKGSVDEAARISKTVSGVSHGQRDESGALGKPTSRNVATTAEPSDAASAVMPATVEAATGTEDLEEIQHQGTTIDIDTYLPDLVKVKREHEDDVIVISSGEGSNGDEAVKTEPRHKGSKSNVVEPGDKSHRSKMNKVKKSENGKGKDDVKKLEKVKNSDKIRKFDTVKRSKHSVASKGKPRESLKSLTVKANRGKGQYTDLSDNVLDGSQDESDVASDTGLVGPTVPMDNKLKGGDKRYFMRTSRSKISVLLRESGDELEGDVTDEEAQEGGVPPVVGAKARHKLVGIPTKPVKRSWESNLASKCRKKLMDAAAEYGKYVACTVILHTAGPNERSLQTWANKGTRSRCRPNELKTISSLACHVHERSWRKYSGIKAAERELKEVTLRQTYLKNKIKLRKERAEAAVKRPRQSGDSEGGDNAPVRKKRRLWSMKDFVKKNSEAEISVEVPMLDAVGGTADGNSDNSGHDEAEQEEEQT